MKMFHNMDKGILTNADMKQTKYKLLYAAMFLFIIVYTVIVFLPVVWILLSGFKDVKEMYAIPASFFPQRIDFKKLFFVWDELKFYQYYIATFAMASGAVAADIIVSGLAGYSLSKLKPRGAKVVLMLLFWLMLMPGTMRMVPLYLEFKSFPIFHFNTLNTYWPIWMMAAANCFDIILFKNFFDGISSSLIEAAKIDGASNLGIFFKIMIPLSVPVFMTVGIFTFNAQLGSFLWPYIVVQNEALTVLGVALYKLKNSKITMDYQMLAFLFAIIPQVIVFAIFQRKIMGGINVGGVKG